MPKRSPFRAVASMSLPGELVHNVSIRLPLTAAHCKLLLDLGIEWQPGGVHNLQRAALKAGPVQFRCCLSVGSSSALNRYSAIRHSIVELWLGFCENANAIPVDQIAGTLRYRTDTSLTFLPVLMAHGVSAATIMNNARGIGDMRFAEKHGDHLAYAVPNIARRGKIRELRWLVKQLERCDRAALRIAARNHLAVIRASVEDDGGVESQLACQDLLRECLDPMQILAKIRGPLAFARRAQELLDKKRQLESECDQLANDWRDYRASVRRP